MMFLDSELSEAERAPETARFEVIPVPYEATVSYGGGTRHGPDAILAASDQLEREVAGQEPALAGIFTREPVECGGPAEEVMARIEAAVSGSINAGRVPVVLGGEHSISYGAVRGALAHGPVGIIQIDAHADLREAYQGERHSHASVMQLLAEEEGVPIIQYGIRAQAREEAERAARLGVIQHMGEALVLGRVLDAELPEDFPERVWVSFDVDGLDPSEMPATGTPVPGGLSFLQSMRIVESALSGRRLIGADVVELAPIAGQTGWDFTAALITYRLMAAALR